MRKILFCEFCNQEIDHVLIHGYDFGDRMMEDVYFKVRSIDGKPECFGVIEDSKAYMKQFNWDHWKERCEEHCKTYDLGTCPTCHDDVVIEDDETTSSKPEPIAINIKSAKDMMDQFKK